MLPLTSVELAVISEEDLEMKWDCLERMQLGKGGTAQVFHVFYKGHDAVLKKSMRDYQDEEKAKIYREAQMVASLTNCANVIRIYGICHTSPYCGMIMEYCAGPNLSELVFQLDFAKVKIDTLRIFKWCHDLARTLCELNATHYHGDVKALNVLVKERPCCCQKGIYRNVNVRSTTYSLCTTCNGVSLEQLSLKLCDFGMCQPHGTKYRGGTPKYAAPETKLGIYTERSEIYSFGYLMFDLVLGKPFEHCGDDRKRFSIRKSHPKFDLSNCNSNSICETITWCTEEDPELRPTFRRLLEKLNNRHNHYTRLRGDDRKSEANREREEFLDHYRIPRNITTARRTTTTSTFLSTSSEDLSFELNIDDNEQPSSSNAIYENQNFVGDTPSSSRPASRKNSEGYELSRNCNFVENFIYTNDDGYIHLPKRKKSKRNFVWKCMVQAKNLIRTKVTNFMIRGDRLI